MTQRRTLSKIAQLAQIPEKMLLQAMMEAELLYYDANQQLQPTPLGYEFEIRTLTTPIRNIILLPADFSALIAYLEKQTSTKA